MTWHSLSLTLGQELGQGLRLGLGLSPHRGGRSFILIRQLDRPMESTALARPSKFFVARALCTENMTRVAGEKIKI